MATAGVRIVAGPLAPVSVTVATMGGSNLSLFSDRALSVGITLPYVINTEASLYWAGSDTQAVRFVATNAAGTVLDETQFYTGGTFQVLSLDPANPGTPRDPFAQPLLADGGGAYNAGTTYTAGKVVTSGGQTFINRRGSTGVAPTASTTTADWLYFPGGSSSGGTLFAGLKVCFFGDSITVGSGTSNATFNFVNQASRIAGTARLQPTVNAGVAGETTSNYMTRLSSVIATAVAAGCDHVHFEGGTNDAGAAASMATFQANVIALTAAARAAGMTVSWNTIPPRGTGQSAAVILLTDQYNLWLRRWCKKAGVPLADAHAALADPTTGNYLAAYTSDGIHPTDAGHLAMARVIAQAIIGDQYDMPWPVDAVSTAGLLSDPLLAATTTWTDQGGTGTGARSLVVPTLADELPAGNWLRWRVNNLAGGGAVHQEVAATLDNTKYSAGDVCEVFAYVQHDDLTDASHFSFRITNGGVLSTGILDTTSSVHNPGPVMGTFTIPGSPGTMRLGLDLTAPAGTDVSAYIGAVQVYNLTTASLIGAF